MREQGPEEGMEEERVWIPSGGLLLEGRFCRGRGLAALVCHPHPGYGGDMENNVVMAAYGALAKLGWSVLRFNFRGVGQSQGTCGDGEMETLDVRAAVRFLGARAGCALSKTVLVGYSFGAWVGLRALSEMEPMLGWVAIAPPAGIWDFSFAAALAGRKLLLVGEEDPFCDPSKLEELMRILEEPKEVVALPGVDHFFRGAELRLAGELERAISSWSCDLKD